MLSILFFLAQAVLFCSCFEVTPVGDVKTRIGESLYYDRDTNSLFYVDTAGEYQLLRYDLGEDKIYKAKIEGVKGRTGLILRIADRCDKFLVGVEHDLKVVKWDGKSETATAYCTQAQLEMDTPTNHIHDGKADSKGRFYVGTLRNDMCNPNSTLKKGGLFRFDDGKTSTQVVSDLGITNDFAIDEVRNILYLVETCGMVISAFDWDPITGALSNRRVAVDFHTELLKEFPDQGPDSVKLDTEGKLWVTAHSGGQVVRFDPDTGKVMQKIPIPVTLVQSLAFGGPEYDILFVSTISADFSIETGKQTGRPVPEHYGTLYKVTNLGVKGRPAPKLPKSFGSCAPEKGFKRFFKN